MKKLCLMAVLGIVFSLSAVADSIQLTSVGGNNQGGVFTVPYFLSINGATPVSTMCDDYTHSVVIGEKWQGNVLSFSDLSTNLGLTRAGASTMNGGLGLGLATAQQDYKELFWLYSQFLATPANANNINFAAWAIFDPSVNTQAGWTTGSNSAAYWLAQAQLSANWSSVNTASYRIISPVDLKDGAGTNPLQTSSPQEYITQVPEPSSIFLFVSGLGGLYWRRRGIQTTSRRAAGHSPTFS